MTWHDKVIQTFPSILRDDIGPELEEKCKMFGHQCAPGFVLTDISKNECDSDHPIRSNSTASAHSCYGKILEIAYCKIINLDLDQVTFENDGPDTHDVKYEDLKIDVTSAKILELHLQDNDPFKFRCKLTISKAKYDSIVFRTSGSTYQANRIAFLQQKLGSIFYFGQIKTETLLTKKYEERVIDNKNCIVFDFSGYKERVPNGIIILY